MITTTCPACSNEIKAPESFLGKKIRCKNDACQQIFVVTESSHETAPADLDSQFVSFPSNGIRAEFPGASPVSNQSFYTQLGTRYPNLQKYLKWGQTVAFIQLVLALVIACWIMLVSIVYPIRWNLAIQDAILPMLVGLVSSISTALFGYFIYVVTMAGIEFVYVIIDIESNTRARQSSLTKADN